MLRRYSDYIFVHLRQKARLRLKLSPKFLSTLGPNPTRKSRPDLQLCSEGTFRSSIQAATYPPVHHTRWSLHTIPLIAECQAGNLWRPIFIVFGLIRPGVEPESTVSAADALSIPPLIGCKGKVTKTSLLASYSIQNFSKLFELRSIKVEVTKVNFHQTLKVRRKESMKRPCCHLSQLST